MDIKTIAKDLNLKLMSASDRINNNVTGGYTGDLLSDVMANSHQGDIWITRQENVPILVSDLSAFELTGKIYNLLNSGK